MTKSVYEAVTGYLDDLTDISISGKYIGYPTSNINIAEFNELCEQWIYDQDFIPIIFKSQLGWNLELYKSCHYRFNHMEHAVAGATKLEALSAAVQLIKETKCVN